LSFIIDNIKTQLAENLPFVVYRKPNEARIKGYFCVSNECYYSKDFQEKGFVFAPFDHLKGSVIFPLEECQVFEDDFVFSELPNDQSTSLKTALSDKESHINLVAKGVDEIKKGVCKKIVLSRREICLLEKFDIKATFERLLHSYENAFAYVWYHPKIGLWMGATPERLVTLEKGNFTTMALASTQSFQGDLNPEWGKKEMNEHQYVIDYIVAQIKDQRNGIVLQEFGISDTYTIKAGNLMHLKADITGKIENFSLKDLLRTLHPTPAVCGLPKGVSKEFILQNEAYTRTFYTGFLGEMNVDCRTELFVNLRCVEFKDNTAIIYVGGGVTEESIPEKEWEETVAKTRIIKNIL